MPSKASTPAKVTSSARLAGERSGPKRDVLTSEVLGKAATLFAARGFAATSLQDIANEIGLSRTSMYYYFPSKEALLNALVRGVTERTTTILAEVDTAAASTNSERLVEAARQLVMWVTDPLTHFKLLDRSEQDLPEDLAAVHRDTRRRVLCRMTKLVENGIDSGEFKPMDARIAAFAILGMCNWTAWWFSPDGDLDRKEAAKQIAALALSSVRMPGAGGSDDMPSILRSIREKLDLIEQAEARRTKKRRR